MSIVGNTASGFEPRTVRISSGPPGHARLEEVAVAVRALVGADVPAMLAWVASIGGSADLPGGGETSRRWELLATAGAHDLTVARVLEPHLDALAILDEAGEPPEPGSTWGVWAAEGPGVRLEARSDGPGRWVLDGRKPWCSLAGSVTHALVTAWVDQDARGLFAVRLADPGITVEESAWSPAGLARVVTTPVSMAAAAGGPVGPSGWYLSRDGFWWGGIGVAAVWYGGAVGLARRLVVQLTSREPDQVALMQLGEVDVALARARTALADAAVEIDRGAATGHRARVLATRVRHVVATAAEDVLRVVAHALGPGPLSSEPEHVARVADLSLYLRQHHAERDAAELGRLLLAGSDGGPPW